MIQVHKSEVEHETKISLGIFYATQVCVAEPGIPALLVQ